MFFANRWKTLLINVGKMEESREMGINITEIFQLVRFCFEFISLKNLYNSIV